jgi:hypothetical protein
MYLHKHNPDALIVTPDGVFIVEELIPAERCEKLIDKIYSYQHLN